MEEKIKKDKYRKTIYACFTGYIVQAVINNFVPLLFLTFQSTYGIPLSRITMLVTINFGLQLLVDLASVSFVDRIGYRASMMIAHVLSGAGLLLLALLPEVLADPFVGILLAVMVYAVGGGLLEVLVSPVVEACPSDNKEKAMSLLHSFYCWGHVGVVLISTVFFRIFGIHHWRILACIWALIPLCNTVAFARVPMGSLMEEGDKGMSIRQLAGQKIFWVFMLMMLCAGASEQAVSQWASTFAEKGLGVSKAIGDLAGPMAFAVLMGASRAFYGKYGDKINLERFMAGSSLLCIAAYLCISLVQSPVIALAGCAVCGLSVGIMWPGTFSKAAAAVPRGGTALFALMALAGDLGCSGGPTLVGMVSSHFGDDLKKGVLAAVVFPLLLLAGIFFCSGKRINVKKIHMSVIFLAGFMLFCGGCGSSRGDNLKDYKIYRIEGEDAAELLGFFVELSEQTRDIRLKNTQEDQGYRINLLTVEQSANEYGYTLAEIAPDAFTILRKEDQLFILSSNEKGIRLGCSYLLHELTAEDGTLLLPQEGVYTDVGRNRKESVYIGNTPIDQYTIYYDDKKALPVCEELQYYIHQTGGDMLSVSPWKDQEDFGIRLCLDDGLEESNFSIEGGQVVISGTDVDSLYQEMYRFVNTYLGWMKAGQEGARISSVSQNIHVPEDDVFREPWIEQREAIIVLWNTNYTRGVSMNEAVSMKTNILDFSEEQLYEYVKMLRFCGFNGVQVTDMCSAWAGADNYGTVHEKIRMIADAAHSMDMKFTLWVWGAKFEGFGWVDPSVSYARSESGFSYDNPDVIATFEKYYSIYVELADCCDRVIAHFYDPGELTTSEDVAYFSRKLMDKFLAAKPDIDFGVSCWIDAFDKSTFVRALGTDITLYEGTSHDDDQKYLKFRQEVAALGTRMGTWAWNTCEMEIDQMAQMNFNLDIIRECYHTARKYDEIVKPSYWSEMDSNHVLNVFSLYCAGQLLIDPDLESDILYAKLSKAVVGGEYADDFAEILRLIQDARSGSTWNKYWWSSEEYLLKSDEYPAESILERCDRYIPVLQEMIDRNVESYSFPFPMPLKEIFQLVLPHLEQIRSFARFRLDLQELEQDWQQAQMDRQAGQNPNGTLETLQDQLYNIAEPISDYNGVVGIWGQIEARAQREMVLDFCSRTGMQVPIYPVWDRHRKQYIYSQLVTDQKGKDTPVNVYTPYYQYGLAYKQETDRLVQELVEEGLFIRNEDGSVYLADWEKYRYHFD